MKCKKCSKKVDLVTDAYVIATVSNDADGTEVICTYVYHYDCYTKAFNHALEGDKFGSKEA